MIFKTSSPKMVAKKAAILTHIKHALPLVMEK
jgi:hypothetical protein